MRVLEARDRVGGRTLNHSVGERPEDVVELGGQWVGPTQHEVMGLIRELGLETYPTHNEGKSVFENPNGKLEPLLGHDPAPQPLVLADYGRADARFKRMNKRVDPDAPWERADAEALDGRPSPTWIRRTAKTRTAREALALGIRACFRSSRPTSHAARPSSTRRPPAAGTTCWRWKAAPSRTGSSAARS